MAAVLVAGGLGTWTAIAADEGTLIRANATAGALAVALLIVALALRVAIAVPVAVALLGAGYLALLGFETDSVDARAPLVAAALFAVAELAYWSLELRGAVADERGSYLRRLALLAAMLAGVTVLGVALLAVVESVEAGGVAADLLGAGAAVGVLTLLALSARRTAQ